MDMPTIILRLLHVLAGTFWVGAVLLTVLFLFKVVADLGPVGGQVMGSLLKRRYFDVLPVVALVTVLSGIDLLRRASAGFDPGWMGSPVGITYSVGALAALVGMGLGIGIGRPATLKAVALGREVGTMADGPAKDTRMVELAALRARGQGALKVTAALLVIATACMAIGRYMK